MDSIFQVCITILLFTFMLLYLLLFIYIYILHLLLYFDSENERSMLVRNVCKRLPDYTVSHLAFLGVSFLFLWRTIQIPLEAF
jgi:hypothetical protein